MSVHGERGSWYRNGRSAGLRRFATAITVLNLLGYAFLGFEGSYAQPFVAALVAYATELALETVDAGVRRRPARYLGGKIRVVEFLLPAHISAMAVSMLLYANENLAPFAFAAGTAIASKYLLRVPVAGESRHVFNPSNLGIAVTLLAFPWVGIAPPYMFTENLGTAGDIVLPAVIVTLGTFLNARFTKRIPLIFAWVTAFAAQGLIRHLAFDQNLVSTLVPMTGVSFLLFTFYMITDPPTTPEGTRAQVAFGASVAAAYGVLLALHVVFGLFFALASVSAVRAAWLWSTSTARLPSTVHTAPIAAAAPIDNPTRPRMGPAT
ncbi:MAG: enediyne biosynthesis protein UnbU [Rhodoglobus sp.]